MPTLPRDRIKVLKRNKKGREVFHSVNKGQIKRIDKLGNNIDSVIDELMEMVIDPKQEDLKYLVKRISDNTQSINDTISPFLQKV